MKKIFSLTPSPLTLKRLAEYLCLLIRLPKNKYTKISSAQLARMMDLKPSQLRQDFHHFGGFGRPGHPYDTHVLVNELKRIYGLEKPINLLLVGATSLASVFCENCAFPKLNIRVCGVVDIEKENQGMDFYGFSVMEPSELKEFLKRTPADIGVICMEDAESAFRLLTDNGVKGVWNPTCSHLRSQEGCVVYNENMVAGLLTLVYNLHHL